MTKTATNDQGQTFVLPDDTTVPGATEVMPEADATAGPPAAERVDLTGLSNQQLTKLEKVRRPHVAAGDVKTTSSETIQDAVPDDPQYAANREYLQGEGMQIEADRAEHETRKKQQEEQRLQLQMDDEAAQVKDRQAQVTESEAVAAESLSQLDASIAQQKEQWTQGGSPGGLFDGSSSSGMILSAVGIALAGLGGAGMQSNAMQMVNSAIDRSMRAQEFQTDSLFKQLQNKYGDRDQARSALKMMQLQYATTMAEHFAAQNATPEIALNLAQYLNDSMKEYLAEEDKFRAREYGKRTQQQNYRFQGGQQGGVFDMSTKEKQANVNLEKSRVDLAAMTREEASARTGKDPGDRWDKEKSIRTHVAKIDGALGTARQAIISMGGEFDENDNLIPGSIKAGGATGLGFGHSIWPEGLTMGDAVKARRAISLAVRKVGTAERGRAHSDKSLDQYEQKVFKGWEGDAAAGVENWYNQSKTNRDRQFNAMSPDVQQFYLNEAAAMSNAMEMNTSPGVRGGRQIH